MKKLEIYTNEEKQEYAKYLYNIFGENSFLVIDEMLRVCSVSVKLDLKIVKNMLLNNQNDIKQI